MRHTIIIFLIVINALFLCDGALGQDITPSPVPLAKAGPVTLTTEDFIRRFESVPFLGRSGKNIESKRLDFIYSILSEKLWMLDAVEKGYDTLSVITTAVEAYEKLFIRDILYRSEIRGKVSFSDREFSEALERQRTALTVDFLYAEDSISAHNLRNLLQTGIPFDTLIKSSPYAEVQSVPETVVYGQMSVAVENVLYSLSVNEFSDPVPTPEGWYIFRVKDRRMQIKSGPGRDDNPDFIQAEKVLRARKEQALYRAFIEKIFGNLRVDVPSATLKNLSSHIYAFVNKNAQEIEGEEYSLTPSNLDEIFASIPPDSLLLPAITINGQVYTYGKFVRLFFFYGIKLHTTALNGIFQEIKALVRNLVEWETLAAEGKKRGYHHHREILDEVTRFRDNLLFQYNRARFFESTSVSDDEVKEMYNRRYKSKKYPEAVNIQEILVNSLENVQHVLTALSAGKDFGTVAEEFNIRKSTREKRGEYGYAPLFLYPAFQNEIEKMNIGDIAGPIKLPEGFSIIKLLGRKSERIELPSKKFDDVKNELRASLRSGRYKKMADAKTVELALKNGIDINAEAFRTLQGSGINTLLIRRLGFGGTVPAAPLLAPDNDWVEDYFKKKSPAP